METIYLALDHLGLPVTILVVLFIAIYRITRWLAPKFEALFGAHIGLVNDLQEQTRVQTDMSRKTLSLVIETQDMIANLPTHNPH